MARWWRHTLIAIAGLAAAVPLRVQLDLGHGSSLPIIDGSALAKGDGNGGGNGNSGGNGNGNRRRQWQRRWSEQRGWEWQRRW